MATPSLCLTPERLLGGLVAEPSAAPIPEAVWYSASSERDGLEYRFPVGALEGYRFLVADLLVDGSHLGVFELTLSEGEAGPTFRLFFGMLNQCSARMMAPLEGVDQNRWQFPREAAWLKPMCAGDIVDLAKVDRMAITVLRKSDRPTRWCMTPVTAAVKKPAVIADPMLPSGPLLDELGQSRLHDWPAKTRDETELVARLRRQLDEAPTQGWPEGFSRWGGWAERRVEATGFFRTHHDGRRWWLVDPDGYLFWSAGMDCVGVNVESACAGLEKALAWLPDASGEFAAARGRSLSGTQSVNYLAANLIRAFGTGWHDAWASVAVAMLRQFGVNTVANWSEWQIARAAGFPYVRPLGLDCKRTSMVFRDFPDVFDPAFEEDCRDYAEQLRETADDPAFIGYFLMNEPTWGFAQQTPAAGMLYNTPACHTRRALSAFLRERHGSDHGLASAWRMPVGLEQVAEGPWTHALTEQAERDLAEFSGAMAERLFGALSDACKRVDPHHLNLGARYYTVPPDWAVRAMRSFDVFSMNCYADHVPEERVSRIVELLGRPVMVGEWHFGALDVGLPGSGIGHVRDQAARGQAYRFYVENAAAQPGCIGVHYFTLYDESALGRFDGENWNIGFVDVCNRPYEPLADAARVAHARMYRVASGQEPPYADAPEYLPKVFL